MVKKPVKYFLDELLVEQGFFTTLKDAQTHIMAGNVIVDDKRIDKPKVKFIDTVSIRVRGQEHPYVSRGGVKLEHALKTWDIPIRDAVSMDVGASTGGFSEVVLNHGARLVYAIDVGYGQLATKLRNDSRVVIMERTHINAIDVSALNPRPRVAVIDVSFISLKKVLPHVIELLEAPYFIVALIKPQFEALHHEIGEGGIVNNEAVQNRIIEDIKDFSLSLGAKLIGVTKSPITGAKGNTEYLIALRSQ